MVVYYHTGILCYLLSGGVPIVKNCDLGLENGLRPKLLNTHNFIWSEKSTFQTA